MSAASLPAWLRWGLLWAVLLAIPLVPFVILALSTDQDPFELWLQSATHRAAVAAIAFSLLAADVLLPVPSSFVAVVSGRALGVAGGGLLNWAAISLSHALGFVLARRWGRPWAERFVGANGLRRAADAWRHGSLTGLILTRPVPVLAEVMAMFAGLTPLPARTFALIVLIANLPHSLIYAWAGARLAGQASVTGLIAAGVGVPTAAYLIFALWRARRP